MPELPEVEVVRSGLAAAVTGARVDAVEIIEPRSLRRHDPRRGDFAAGLSGQRLLAAVRRGKFLWMPLSHDHALVAHLGMSGQLLLRAPEDRSPRHLRLRLLLDHPAHGSLALHFVDQRIFGSMAIDSLEDTRDGGPGGYSADASGSWSARIPHAVAHIARDPLDPYFSDTAFIETLARCNSGVKRVLLDQARISGIGNIYADEALWATRLHFEQPASSLSVRRARQLLAAIRHVLEKALAEGGTSFDAQYVNVNGASGYFAHSLNVYGRHGQPCPRCGTPIQRRAFMNRSSHFCPRCQRRRGLRH